MNFYQALAARNGVRHLSWGGDIGGAVGDAGSFVGNNKGAIAGTLVGGPIGTLAGGLMDKKGLGGSLGTAASNAYGDMLNPNKFTPTMPTNTFNAAAPNINQMNFQPAAESGMSAFDRGNADLGQMGNNLSTLAGQAGQTLGQQQNLYGQQQGLADALLAQSKGQGPNPAQLQFQQNQNQAIQQQAGTTASARGINPALAARMGAQQGAAMQQQGVGQAGVLQAQQQLAAQGQLAGVQGAMGNTLNNENSTFANQGNLYNAAGGAYGRVGEMGAGLFNTAAGANNGQNNTITAGTIGTNQINAGVASGNQRTAAEMQGLSAGVAEQNAKAKSAVLGGLANSAGGLLGKMPIPGMGGGGGAAAGGGDAMAGGADAGDIAGATTMVAAHGGQVPDHKALALAHALMAVGGNVPGQAKVSGDAAENDTVPAVLSPKEIVLPRSVTMAPDAAEKAKEFVEKLKGKESSGPKGYGKVLAKHKEVMQKMEELKKMMSGGYAA